MVTNYNLMRMAYQEPEKVETVRSELEQKIGENYVNIFSQSCNEASQDSNSVKKPQKSFWKEFATTVFLTSIIAGLGGSFYFFINYTNKTHSPEQTSSTKTDFENTQKSIEKNVLEQEKTIQVLERELVTITQWPNINSYQDMTIKKIIRDTQNSLDKYKFEFNLSDYSLKNLEDIKNLEKRVLKPSFLEMEEFKSFNLRFSNPEQYLRNGGIKQIEESLNKMFFEIDKEYFKENFITYADFLDSLDVEYNNIDWASLIEWTNLKNKRKAAEICRNKSNMAYYFINNSKDLPNEKSVQMKFFQGLFSGNMRDFEGQLKKAKDGPINSDTYYFFEQIFEKNIPQRLASYRHVTKKEIQPENIDVENAKRMFEQFLPELLKTVAISTIYADVEEKRIKR